MFGGICIKRSRETTEMPGPFYNEYESVPESQLFNNIIVLRDIYLNNCDVRNHYHFESVRLVRAVALSICFRDCFI
jgi:hypothetical protein